MKNTSISSVVLAVWLTGISPAIDQRYDFTSRNDKMEKLSYTERGGLIVPFDCVVYVSADGGWAGASSELGVGLSPKTFRPVLKNLPERVAGKEREESKLGTFSKGSSIPLALRTVWRNKIHYAFVGSQDLASRTAFFDVDKVGILPRRLLKMVGKNIYQLRLDDAASYLIDDNEGDMVIRIRIEPMKVKA